VQLNTECQSEGIVPQEGQARSWRRLARRWGPWALLVGAFGGVHWRAVGGLIHHWSTNDTSSFGFAIPPIAAYLAWQRRPQFAASISTPPALVSLWPLVLSLGCNLVGRSAGVLLLEELALVPALVGVILILAGRRAVQSIGLPLAYLFLMIPFWDSIADVVHGPFQGLSAWMAAGLLRLAGFSVLREGTVLTLPTHALEVAPICSGINYILAVVALGLAVSSVALASWPRRAAVLLLAVVVALGANGVRIAIIGILLESGVTANTHGPSHVLQGLFVAAVGYLVIGAGIWMLRSRSGALSSRAGVTARSPIVASPTARRRVESSRVHIVTAVLAAVASLQLVAQPSAIWPLLPLATLPAQLGSWSSVGAPLAAPIRVSGADLELMRAYVSESQPPVTLYVAYFASQGEGRSAAPYATKELETSGVIEQISAGDRDIPVYSQLNHVGDTAHLVSHFYVADNAIVATRPRAKLRTLAGAALHRRTGGAVVVIDQAVEQPLAAARATRDRFVRAIWPALSVRLLAGTRPQSH
jgi:EpsI family protein